MFNSATTIEVEDVESDEESEPEVDGIPTIKIVKEVKERIRKPWRKVLIIKLVGRTVAYKTLISRIIALWKLKSDFDCIDLGNGFYAIKFHIQMDRMKVFTKGPLKIMDHYLTVQKWKPNFLAEKASVSSTAVWVHIPGLPIEYFDKSVLVQIGKAIGIPLKLDYITAWTTRGRFTRICVEIDLNKPLLPKVRVDNTTFNIEYEG
ncbi:uncharacterized protein LOC120139067 [Hibiscus syriacus]|uniref:uncharacterized protein LOC120139067 n=1 Tax=Hibiscus syriacus TaxID=106335 RepID=UPI00192409FB|nr:uncharacterized protein LOC120139067 [Hibiscus syriacus]